MNSHVSTTRKHVNFLINILCLAAVVLPALVVVDRLLAAAAASAACTPLSVNIEKQSCNPTRAGAKAATARPSPTA